MSERNEKWRIVVEVQSARVATLVSALAGAAVLGGLLGGVAVQTPCESSSSKQAPQGLLRPSLPD